jgi:hypothetical protein
MVGRVFWGAEGCNAGSMFSGKTIYWEGNRPRGTIDGQVKEYTVLLAPFRIVRRRIGDKVVTGE